MHVSSSSSLKGVVRTPTKQKEDHEDDDTRVVVFLAKRNVRATTKQEEE